MYRYGIISAMRDRVGLLLVLSLSFAMICAFDGRCAETADWMTLREWVRTSWTSVAKGCAKTLDPGEETGASSSVVRRGSRYLTSVGEALSDYLSKGRYRKLRDDASLVSAEFDCGGRVLWVAVNLTDGPVALTLPGYKGVFHEFRGSRTFVFSPFATQPDIAVDMAPGEVILGTSDNCQDGGVAFSELQRQIGREEDARRLRSVRPLGDVPEEGVRLRLGVLSDVHLSVDDPVRGELLKCAFECLDARRVDGVVICGDLTQNGRCEELLGFGAVWDSVFPGNRRSDGGHVEKLFVYGDHDVETFTSGSPGLHRWLNKRPHTESEMRRHDIALNDRAKQWKEAFHEDFSPIVRKTLRRYDFVLAHLHNDSSVEGLRYADPLYIPGLEEFFRTNRFDRMRPFFYVQHKIPKGTVGGPSMPGQDSGRTSAVLGNFPNALAFCGHKHRSARDERMLWQGAFTVVQVPGVNPVQTEAGYENGWSSADRPDSVPPRQMAPLAAAGDCVQGLLVSVYDDRMIIERREFLHGGEVAEPWIVPTPNRGEASYEKRAEKAAALPRFAPSAVVSIRETEGKDRNGKVTRQIVVTCPAAPSDGAVSRPYAYEFRPVVAKGFVARTAGAKRVFSPRGYLAEAFDGGPVDCVFAKNEIPSDHDTVVFEVRPVDAFGRFGEPIMSNPLSFNPTPSCLYPF